MSLRDDPNYFPQPDVPSDGNYTGNFGRELLYYGYSPRSASIEAANAAAGPKTATSGKYTFDSATGQYTWVPAGSTVKTDTATDYKSGLTANDGGRGNDGVGGGASGGDGFDRGSPLGGRVGDTGTAYGNLVSGLATYGNTLGGMLPGGMLANIAAQAMMPSATASVANASQRALADAIAKDPTFGGGNYSGVGGTTSATGAGIAASPMSVDPATAQGQSMDVGGYGETTSAGSYAHGGLTALASGGLGSLGSYSDGGRLLRGPGDGVSDSIPATIGKVKRPARLADGEFVVPARIVSELGNGSTEAGARKLYAMLDRIQKGRKKSIGKGKVAVNSRMDKHLPA